MRRFILLLLTLPATVASAESLDDAVAKVKPALVRIHVVSTTESQGREVKYEASGSGAIITPAGHVITNHHVAQHATRLVCVLSSNEEIEADLIGTDALADIAVIKLRGEPGRKFPFVGFGDSDKVRVGDTVLAMGCPLALSQSVTRGIVSNTRMTMPASLGSQAEFTLDGEDVGSFVRWIGHDATIHGGNSGGPLVNLKGDVIGINEIKMGLGGAIPGNLAQSVARQLMATGQVRRSWLGIGLQPLLKKSPHKQGVLVNDVQKNSPAARAGFEPGDILLKLAGKDVSVRFWEELPLFNQMVAEIPVGTEVEAVVLRAAKRQTLRVCTSEREQARPDAHELKPWGITVRDISAVTALELKRDNRDGVLVTSVRPGGPSGQAIPALHELDVLTQIAGKPVTNVAALAALTPDKTTPMLVEFDRKSEKLLTVVKVGLRDLDDPSVETPKAWLPVSMQAITREMAEQLGSPTLTGVRVTQVYADSTAEKAGLKVGDLIVAFDGDALEISHPGEEEVLTSLVRQYKIGAKPELKILRGKETLTLPVELARSPRAEREMKKYLDENFDFTARDLTFHDKVDDKEPADLAGALVTEVKNGGWAALARLSGGDIVVAVDDVPVSDVTTLQAAMKQVAARQSSSVVLRVLRGVHTLYLQVLPDWNHNK